MRKVATWVCTHELPIELYNNFFLRTLGSQMGNMLKIDKLTSNHSRGQFTKLCVKIDLDRDKICIKIKLIFFYK